MSNKPPIYGRCPAGCNWETVHKEDFINAAALFEVLAEDDGSCYLNQGKQYKIISSNSFNTSGLVISLRYTFLGESEDDEPYIVESNITQRINDEYATSAVFKYLDAIIGVNEITFIYEVAGIRYKEVVSDLTIPETYNSTTTQAVVNLVNNIDKVFLYNEDATYSASVKGEKGDAGSTYTGTSILTLSASGWNEDKTQTVELTVDTAKRNVIDVEAESVENWAACGVYATTETPNSITFKCSKIPSTDLHFRVVSVEVNYVS